MMDPKNFDQGISDYDYKGSFTKGKLVGVTSYRLQEVISDFYPAAAFR